MSTSPDLATPSRHRRASTSDSDRRRQKRRRCDAEYAHPSTQSDAQPDTSAFAQISTCPDVVVDDKPRPTGEEASSLVPVAASPIDLTVPSKADRRASSSSPTTSTPELLSAYTCPICLSPPTNATLIACGHVCCGQCLFTAVKSTMRRNFTPTARCPVCRAEIVGWDGRGGGVVGLKMQVLYSL